MAHWVRCLLSSQEDQSSNSQPHVKTSQDCWGPIRHGTVWWRSVDPSRSLGSQIAFSEKG